MKKRVTAILALVLALAMLAGCGASSAPAETKAPEKPATDTGTTE